MKLPSPGCAEAVFLGCVCPILENEPMYYLGLEWRLGKPIVSYRCLLHRSLLKEIDAQGVSRRC